MNSDRLDEPGMHALNEPAALVEAYETIRDRLPEATFPDRWRQMATLEDVIDAYDVFLFDAFGVLNIGESAIPGAVDRIGALRAAGKRLLVVSNAASVPASALLAKYRRLGFSFALDQIVSSRHALLAALNALPMQSGNVPVKGRYDRTWQLHGAFRWGVMAAADANVSDLPASVSILLDDEAVYESSDGFILLASGAWSEARQARLLNALRQRPRPVLVANPDLVAPRESGWTQEPGYFARVLERETGLCCEYFGKPFANIFEITRQRLGDEVQPSRVLMVGDTLHTDVLGGRAAGFDTALVTDFGVSRGLDLDMVCARIGITPNLVVGRI